MATRNMNGFGMLPNPLQASAPMATGAPGLGTVPPANSLGTPPNTFSGAPSSPPAAGAPAPPISPLAALLAGVSGGAVGPQAAAAGQMPMAQQSALYGVGQPPGGYGGGGLSPSDTMAMLLAGTNF
jgi:hypothetical protein